MFLEVKFSIYLNRRVFVMKCLSRYMGRSKRKRAFEHAQNVQILTILQCAKSRTGICSLLKHSVVSNDSVCGQRRPCSDCAYAQSDLVFRCSHMPKDTFSPSTAYMVPYFAYVFV